MVNETNISVLKKMQSKLIEVQNYKEELNKLNSDIEKIQEECDHNICVVTKKDIQHLGYSEYIQEKKYCLFCGKQLTSFDTNDIDMSEYVSLSDKEKLLLIRNYYTEIVENYKYVSDNEMVTILNYFAKKEKEKLLEKKL